MIYFLTKGDYQFDGIIVTQDEELCSKILHDLPFLGYDKETTHLNTLIARELLDSIGDRNTQVVIDRTTVNPKFLQELADKRKFWGHNIKYDVSVSLANGLVIRNVGDTMIRDQRLGLGSGRLNNLKDVYERRTGKMFPTSKDIRSEFVNWPENKKFESKHIIYSAGDVATLEDIIEPQSKIITACGMDFLIDIEERFLHILSEIEVEGWYLDKKSWLELIELAKRERYQFEVEMDSILEQLKEVYPKLNEYIFKRELVTQADLFGGAIDLNPQTFNYGSPQQVLEIFKQVDLPIPTQNKKDEKLHKKVVKPSVSEDALNEYLIKYPRTPLRDFIITILKHKKVVKKISSFGERFLVTELRKKDGTKVGYENKVTGKVHTTYRQCMTDNGRLASGEEDLGFYNSQNLPKENRYRKCFTLSPQEISEGWKICTMDLSGAEAVLAASLSGELKIMQFKDIHSELATPAYVRVLKYIRDSFYDDKEQQVQEALLLLSNTKAKATREFAVHSLENWQTFTINKTDGHLKENRDDFKKVVYGAFYGATSNRIAEVMNIPLPYADLIDKQLRKELPILFKYLDDNAQKAKEQGKITFNTRTNSRHIFKSYLEAAQYGRALTYTEWGEMERASKNYPVSGSQADAIKEAMVEIDDYVKSTGTPFKWKGQVHDEIIFKFKEEGLEHKIAKILTDTCDKYLVEGVHMACDYHVNTYWEK